jgi:hypothetical protein
VPSAEHETLAERLEDIAARLRKAAQPVADQLAEEEINSVSVDELFDIIDREFGHSQD